MDCIRWIGCAEPISLSMSKPRRIIDAHHHLWDLDACHYPWLMAQGVERFFGDPTPIQKNYLVDDLREDAAQYELEGSVHIQVGVAAGDEVRETAWLQSVAEAEGLPSAIVGFCDLSDPGALQQIAEHQAFPSLRGIRQIIGRSDAEDAQTGSAQLLDAPAWRANLAQLGDLGLSFDLQLTPSQVDHAVDVLAGAPDTAVAICHCGSPWDQSEPGLSSWRRGMQRLAELPNVSCKISGLGMFDHSWTTDSIRPIVESCIEIFGVNRAMFGSNFPVDKLHASYTRVWEAFAAICDGLPAGDQRQLFSETARRFYRIS